jgi:hypothetical protein
MNTPEPATVAYDAEKLRYRTRKLSPAEQWTARMQSILPPQEFPDACVALLLHQQRSTKVTSKGEIHLDHLGKTYKFWHLHSVTCRQAGAQVFLSWNPASPEFVYIINRAEKKFVEVVPEKNLCAWFNYDEHTRAEIAAHRQYIRQVADELNRLHQPTAREEADRLRTNAEKLRATVTFDPPAGPRAAASAPVADAIVGAEQSGRNAVARRNTQEAEEKELVQREGTRAAADILAPSRARTHLRPEETEEESENAGASLLSFLSSPREKAAKAESIE